MKKALVLSVLVSVLSWATMPAQGQAGEAGARREAFLRAREDMLQTIAKQHIAIESRAPNENVRRLLIKQSSSGESYGKYSRIYYFTEEGHPAHPAVMIVRVLEKDGHRFISRQGETGGDKDLFEQWVNDSRAGDRADAADILSEVSQKQSSTRIDDAPSAWSDQITQLSQAYFRARDKGDFQSAHAFFEASTPVPLNPWSADKSAFNQKAGPVMRRTVAKITWYRNPTGAPAGIYGAVDFDSDFKNLEVHCGYLMWRMQPDGQGFKLISETESEVDKLTARKMNGVSKEALKARLGCRG